MQHAGELCAACFICFFRHPVFFFLFMPANLGKIMQHGRTGLGVRQILFP